MNRQYANSSKQTNKPSIVFKTLKCLKTIVFYVPIVVQKIVVSLSLRV